MKKPLLLTKGAKRLSREDLKPYADSEKLGYLYISGTFDETKKHVFKDKVLLKDIVIYRKKLIWMDRNRPPLVVTNCLGTLDHCFVDKRILKYKKVSHRFGLLAPVQVISYQRGNGSTSYAFETVPKEKESYATALCIVETFLIDKVKLDVRMNILGMMLERLNCIGKLRASKKCKGFQELAAFDLDLDLIQAITWIAYKVMPKEFKKLEKECWEREKKQRRRQTAPL